VTMFVCGACGANYGMGEVHPCGGRNASGGACSEHGAYVGVGCPACAAVPRDCEHEYFLLGADKWGVIQTQCGKCGQLGNKPPPSATDVRALLWAGMYLAGRCWLARMRIRAEACEMADEAVADFDEHYLGRKPGKETP
jgi:hypothetical protein